MFESHAVQKAWQRAPRVVSTLPSPIWTLLLHFGPGALHVHFGLDPNIMWLILMIQLKHTYKWMARGPFIPTAHGFGSLLALPLFLLPTISLLPALRKTRARHGGYARWPSYLFKAVFLCSMTGDA